jgi:hypothetical protein
LIRDWIAFGGDPPLIKAWYENPEGHKWIKCCAVTRKRGNPDVLAAFARSSALITVYVGAKYLI